DRPTAPRLFSPRRLRAAPPPAARASIQIVLPTAHPPCNSRSSSPGFPALSPCRQCHPHPASYARYAPPVRWRLLKCDHHTKSPRPLLSPASAELHCPPPRPILSTLHPAAPPGHHSAPAQGVFAPEIPSNSAPRPPPISPASNR